MPKYHRVRLYGMRFGDRLYPSRKHDEIILFLVYVVFALALMVLYAAYQIMTR